MKYIFFALSIILAISFIASPLLVFAQTQGGTGIGSQIQQNLGDVGEGAGFKSESETGGLPALVGKIINIFLGILGVIFVVLIVYGGYTWMTSFGNTEKVNKAKSIIIDAAIGIIILLAAYAISNFVVGSLIKATVS